MTNATKKWVLGVLEDNRSLGSDGGLSIFGLGALQKGVDLLTHDLVENGVRQMRVKHAPELEGNLEPWNKHALYSVYEYTIKNKCLIIIEMKAELAQSMGIYAQLGCTCSTFSVYSLFYPNHYR